MYGRLKYISHYSLFLLLTTLYSSAWPLTCFWPTEIKHFAMARQWFMPNVSILCTKVKIIYISCILYHYIYLYGKPWPTSNMVIAFANCLQPHKEAGLFLTETLKSKLTVDGWPLQSVASKDTKKGISEHNHDNWYTCIVSMISRIPLPQHSS